MNQVRIQRARSFSKAIFKSYTSIGVLVDENTKRFCYDAIKKWLPPHFVLETPAGEEHKNLVSCGLLWQQMTDLRFDRHSLLIVLGGGVLGDMGGFCASVYKRGIDFLLLPTTLLAQVDASIGAKTAVDFGSLKNHLGVFNSPVAALIDTDFLTTLPLAELRSGFAEVIKHCLISDKQMWETIRKKKLEDQDWPRLVRHSVKFKSKVVTKDPIEKGIRKILNYGHSLGHAVEGYFLHSGHQLLHGEAIAAGMILEGHIARNKKLLSSEELESIQEYIFSVFGKINLPDADQLMPALHQDKKNKGKEILLALPKHIGKAIWDVQVNEKEIRDAVLYYQSSQT